MCGIAGIWNLDGKPVPEETIIRFTDSLAHRGPDGRGVWRNAAGSLAFGHRRLATIDPRECGNQPMHYAEGRYHIVFNGEIFNFIEIREELMRKGYVFTTDSDTEVIMAAYHEWREHMLPRFNGMWALTIYDSEREECFISRDRFGIKPFLYRITNDQFAFASEQKAFLRLDGFRAEPDQESAVAFLKTGFGVEASRRTMIAGVHKLKAGHWGIVKDRKLTSRRWWSTYEHLHSVPASFNDQAEQFRELFYDSVKLRMRSDVALGSCLSGGFDSSAIVSAISDIGNRHGDARQALDWQHTFVATFPGKSNDERPQAEEVVKYTGVTGHFFEVREDEALGLMDRVLYDFDDVYVGIPVAPWLIYREVRRNNVIVSLDGHGADELMGAYMHAAGAYLTNAPSLTGHLEENRFLLSQALQAAGGDDSFGAKLRMLWQYHPDFAKGRDVFATAKNLKDQFFRTTSSRFLSRDVDLAPGEDFRHAPDDIPGDIDESTRILYRLFHHDVLPTILRNFDRMSMAHGIEVRMPFMDWRLVSYVFSLPGSSKIKGGYTKRVAREAMRGRMPESIRASKVKIGFNAPMPEWFKGPLQGWISEVLAQAEKKGDPLIDVKALKVHLDQVSRSGAFDWSNTGNAWKYLHYLWFQNNFMQYG